MSLDDPCSPTDPGSDDSRCKDCICRYEDTANEEKRPKYVRKMRVYISRNKKRRETILVRARSMTNLPCRTEESGRCLLEIVTLIRCILLIQSLHVMLAILSDV